MAVTPDRAHASADKQLEKMERHIHDTYSRAADEVRERYAAFFANISPEIQKAFDDMEAAKRGGDQKAIAKAQKHYTALMNQYSAANRRYTALVDMLTGEISKANETALKYVEGKLPPIYAENFAFAEGQISAQVPSISFTLLDENTVRNLLTSEELRLPPPRKLDIPADKLWNRQHINAELTQGILQGEGIPAIADRMRKVVGMNEVSAVRNARTMVTAAENKGRLDGMKKLEGMGTIVKRVWLAAHDSRVRDLHKELDGQERGMEEPFEVGKYSIMYPGDPSGAPEMVYNCRCTTKAKVVGFNSNLPPEKRGAIIVKVM